MDRQTPDSQPLTERIEKLERCALSNTTHLRIHRFILGVTLLLILLFVLLPRLVELWRPKAVSARSLVVKDRDGSVRVSLAVVGDSTPSVTVRDRDGRIRALLGVFDDGTSNLILADEEGEPRVVLEVSEKGDASLRIYDEGGRLVWATPRSAAMDEEIVPAIEDETAQDLPVKEE